MTTPETADPDAAPKRKRWFVINVAALVLIAPWATYWFQKHLQLYFTEIVIVGGAFSFWVMVQGMWAMFERTSEVDVGAYSRKFLGSRDLTIMLVFVVIVLAVLWARTASLYIEYHGAPGEGEYRVEVIRKVDGSPLIPSTTLSAANAVVGGPTLWLKTKLELECRILEPVKYQALPCDLEPGSSTRISLPGSFATRDFHLLRLVPSERLYAGLALVDEHPTTRCDLELKRGTDEFVFEDLRRQTLYTGAAANEMPILMALEQPDAFRQHVFSKLTARRVDSESANLMTAILTLNTKVWPTYQVRTGDVLELAVRSTNPDGGCGLVTAAPSPVTTYTVTDEKVQTLWFPRD